MSHAARQLIITLWLLGLSAITCAESSNSGKAESSLPGIALIIDDLGDQYERGLRVVNLPGPVACAFLPNSPHTDRLARLAHARQKEILLHMPMQAVEQGSARPDAGMLTLDMTEQQFRDALASQIDSVPHISGINNHKGSLLTRHPGNMAWVMQAINSHGGLFFVDSRTTSSTVARQIAREYGVPNIDRNVFLDNQPDQSAIRARFRELIAIAKREGTALAIGHPYPATLAVLASELATLESRGVQLLPVSRLIHLQNKRRPVWQVSLSR